MYTLSYHVLFMHQKVFSNLSPMCSIERLQTALRILVHQLCRALAEALAGTHKLSRELLKRLSTNRAYYLPRRLVSTYGNNIAVEHKQY